MDGASAGAGRAPDPATGTDELPRGLPTLLLGAVLLLAALYLSPLGGFAYFGSDSGEYYALTHGLVTSGRLPVGGSYGGWGTGYPDFPGLFVVVGAIAGATATPAAASLSYGVPVLSAVAVAPLFLLFRRLFPSDGAALLGAGFASVAMPRAFALAHPAPLALGDLLAVSALWMFVESRRDARWYAPLALVSAAVVLTHHLSSYFFLVIALGVLVGLELLRPRAWSVRFPLRELVFLGAFVLGLDAYWFGLAPDFVAQVIVTSRLLGLGAGALGAAIAVGALAVLAAAGLAIRRRRRSPLRSLRVAFPSDRSVARDALLLGALTFGGVGAIVLVPLPGTEQTATLAEIAFFSPVLGLAVLAAGTRRLTGLARLGPAALTGLLALGLSAVVALASPPVGAVLPPVRHAEYLVIPLGLLVGIALARYAARASDRAGRRAGVAVGLAAALLLTANAAVAFPPPADLGRFQEGLTNADATLAMWSVGGLPAGSVVASDHRLSSELFGFDGLRATWDSTPHLLTSSDRAAAAAELRGVPAPHDERPVQAVAVDETMRTVGVALDPSALAAPMTPEASQWLAGPPFVPVYENGAETVYWVSGPMG